MGDLVRGNILLIGKHIGKAFAGTRANVEGESILDDLRNVRDMRAAALGIDNVQMTSRDLASLVINQMDGSIERVSAEHSKTGPIVGNQERCS